MNKISLRGLLLYILMLSPILFLTPFHVYFSNKSGFPFFLHIFFFLILLIFSLFAVYKQIKIDSSNKERWLIFLVYLCLFVTIGICSYNSPITTPRKIGAPTVYLIFATLIYLFLFSLWSFNRIIFYSTILTVLILTLLKDIDYPINVISNKNISGLSENKQDDCIDEISCFDSWLKNRPDLEAHRKIGKPYPVYLISAAGGGIYAASNTFATLERANAYCPSFRQHIFAISSVSGGSFGAAHFALKKELNDEIKTFPKCIEKIKNNVDRAFSKDYFSPVLFSFIYSNIMNFILPFNTPYPDSATSLEDTFNMSLDNPNMLESVNKTWSSSGTVPALFFNITNITNGRTNIISPFSLLLGEAVSRDNYFDQNHFAPIGAQLSATSAASLSARFPFITPTGSYDKPIIDVTDIPKKTKQIYADGGYVDNSGASVLREIQNSIKIMASSDDQDGECDLPHESGEFCGYVLFNGHNCAQAHQVNLTCGQSLWASNRIPIEVITISIDVIEKKPNSSKQTFYDPIIAMFNVRTARGEIEQQGLLYDICGLSVCHDAMSPDHPFLEFLIDNEDLRLPLSWSIGSRKYQNILDKLGHPVDCATGQSEDASQNNDEENREVFIYNDCNFFDIADKLQGNNAMNQ